MGQYVEVISKIKPKNQSDFKILDISDIEVDFTPEYNVLCVNPISQFTQSGISWDLLGSSGCLISGDLHLYGNLYEYSDRRLKQNIIEINSSLDTVCRLNGVQFTWISNKQKDYGIIAQEVEQILPQLVTLEERTGYKQVNYIKLIPFLLQSIKQLNKKVSDLQSKLKV